MTTKDYSPLVQTAVLNVARYGRVVKLRRLDTTSVTDTPWRGNPLAPVDVTYSAIFVGPTKALSEDFLKDLEDVAIIAGNVDLSTFHELVDGSTVWRIVRQQTVKPGGQVILTYLGLSR